MIQTVTGKRKVKKRTVRNVAKGYIVLVIKVKFAVMRSIVTALQQVQGEVWLTIYLRR